MASTYTLKSSTYDGRYLELTCTQTQNITNNTSTISWTLTSAGGANNYYSVGPTTVKINNEQAYYKARVAYSAKTFPAAKGSTNGSIEVKHNNDGSLSIPVSLTTAIYSTSTATQSGTWTLDTIPRGAAITSAPNFTDEGNPEVKYTNYVGSVATSLQACIASTDGKTMYANYRDISKTGSSYTFSLTTAERNALRNATPNSNTMSVKFYIKTIVDGYTVYSSVAKTLTIANPNPICNPTIVDTGSLSTQHTGDPNKVINGYNVMKITFGASAVKGATIKSQKVVCGGKSRTTDGTLDYVTSDTFTFTITDSRGNTTTKVIKKTFINYFKPTVNLESINLSSDGVLTANLAGRVWIGNFGAKNNAHTLQYRYRVSGGSWSSWTNMSLTLDTDGTYSVSETISGLDYRKTYVFQAMMLDTVCHAEASGIKTPERAVSSYPVFDWSAEDFNVNVPFNMNGQTILRHNASANNVVLSSSGGFIYFRPGGTDPGSPEVLITPQGNIQLSGDILINGKSLLTALRNAGISI